MTGEAVTPETFRQAWSNFGTGVTVITTAETNERDAEVKVHGMTANGVVSVSLDPPLALACIGHNRNSFPLIKANRRFGISILSSAQQYIAQHYTKPPEERGSDEHISFARLGDSTVLAEALTAMDCRVVSEHEAGDHTLFVAEIEHVNIREGEPLLWFQGSFGRFAAE